MVHPVGVDLPVLVIGAEGGRDLRAVQVVFQPPTPPTFRRSRSVADILATWLNPPEAVQGLTRGDDRLALQLLQSKATLPRQGSFNFPISTGHR